MKTKIIFSLLLILVVSCSKDKSDARKMVGTWKRDLVDGMTGNILGTDTVIFSKQNFTQNNVTYNYYIGNGNLNFYQTNDTSSLCYSFMNKDKFTLGCFSSPGGSYNYILTRTR